MRTKGFLLRAAVIVLAGAWVFWPGIHGGWIWDDYLEIIQNRFLRDRAGIGKIWFRPEGMDYFPLKTTVQWIEWHLWGDRVEGYHLVSIGLHLLSALLLWRLLRKLGMGLGAWLGALLFAVHPLMVESVAWISEFKNTLSLPFLLLAMITYVDWDRGRDRPAYFISLGLFLAAMLCKSSVVMFPMVILLYGWWKRGRIARSDLRASAPFFAVSLILGLVSVWFQQHRAIAGEDISIGGFWSRCAGAGLAVFFYLGKYLFPADLMPDYPRWELNPPAPWQFWPWVAIAAALWLSSRPSKYSRPILFGLGFFLINLVPVLGFIPMSYLRISRVADHFAYLPLIGLIGLTAAAVEKIGKSLSRFLSLPLSLFLILVAALAWQGHRYARIFTSDEMFWTYTLEHNPKSWLALNDLGVRLAGRGRILEAIEYYKAALRVGPDDFASQKDLGDPRRSCVTGRRCGSSRATPPPMANSATCSPEAAACRKPSSNSGKRCGSTRITRRPITTWAMRCRRRAGCRRRLSNSRKR